ncbi:arylamine N-acetyltransferase [Halorussus gelatinilyticus]|uniref:Arylamine N-acetyltransferase n=1 Tax=Halorussus gelatinilyticus TaxID=2937524 RepID=A0A8U0IIW1_9EURY|nr:arylamine N-acetyltransferase [Halorussus gelatinilyticus]UPW00212.1 arylamine N-acetyltransferase [Halorussus gelatinilyticus]
MSNSDTATAPNPDDYLERIGLDPASVRASDAANRETLAALQRAHVATVPFETLAVTGDPFGPRDGEGVTLTLPHLYKKVVARERGGFCFELNGLFGWLLAELGFDADRIAARMLSDDGDPRPPANHHAHLASLDRTYVVDVGCGVPTMRRPLPLDGSVREDSAGVAWRVVESERPDAEYLTQYRTPGDEGWRDRYVFDATPRKLSYFEATCDHLATAPESSFTGDPTVSIATERGHRKLSPEKLTRSDRGEHSEREVGEEEWYGLLESEFGLRYAPE